MLVGSTPVATFFAPFAVSLMVTRFVGMKHLQRLLPQHLAAFGLLAYLLCLLLLTSATSAAVGCSGCLFGFAYGVMTPSCIEWSARLYPGNKRPVALINTSFNVGSIIALQLTGVLLALVGWTGVILALAALVLWVLTSILARNHPYAAAHQVGRQ
jgi:predicted MFS family arabinose efflux permease